ncbi:hypothetical protein NECAME_01207 [Necator americanus]|uniref:Uncharacterized protein n=1 Tax=Necator americanus TaxID=51031 RepID=W2TYA2_NECAM|nr:hypothetical protein NECAME_01207 [Necator americanus]ETN87050.1 hypothetical protein NECAME_01207 [Necator americanus]
MFGASTWHPRKDMLRFKRYLGITSLHPLFRKFLNLTDNHGLHERHQLSGYSDLRLRDIKVHISGTNVKALQEHKIMQ